MAEVKVLIEGYVVMKDNELTACSSVVLIEDKKIKIVVDPGTKRKQLLKSLTNEGLKVEDIDYVVLTHYHLDHSYLAAIFSNAKLLDNTDMYIDDKIVQHDGIVPGTSIKIIQTPGHAKEHCSLVASTKKGTIVIAGDLFWRKSGEKQETSTEMLINQVDPYVKDENALKESRKKILKIADYIIPGHGKMFKVKK